MENKKTKTPDPTKMNEEDRRAMERWTQNKQIITYLSDMADSMQGLNLLLKEAEEETEKNSKQTGAILVDLREAVNKIKARKDPELPDFAQPIVDMLKAVETSLTDALKAIDVKPQVNVASPNVSVKAPDLKGIEKVLKTDVPKAFKEAIKLIPDVEIPETDFTEVVQSLETLGRKLDDIDTGVRLKTQFPKAFEVSNLPQPSLIGGIDYNYIDVQQTDSDTETYVFKAGGSGGTTVQTIVVNYTSSAKSDIDNVTWS